MKAGEALQSSEADITVKKQALASAQETLQSLQAAKDQKDTALSQAQNDFQQAQTEIERIQSEVSAKEAEVAKAEANLSAAKTAYETEQNNQKAGEAEQADAEQQLENAKKTQSEAEEKVTEAQKVYDRMVEAQKNAQALALKGSYGFFAYKDKDNKALDILEDTKLKAAGDKVAISSYTEIGNEDDATSLENMKLALEFIKKCNDLRVENGLEPLKVSDEMMAISQVQANWSAFNGTHSRTYYVGENLAWRYQDPFDVWYDYEKKVYEETGSESRTGHYRNIVNKKWAMTGFAVTARGNGLTTEQSFGYAEYYSANAKSFEEYNQEFQEYYNLVMNSSAGTSQALEALNTAKQELEKAQKQVEAAVWAIEQAKQKQAEASAKMQQKQQEINNNTQAVQEAQEKLAQAQQKHSQSAEANAAAHTAVEKAEKEAQEARQAVKTQQQAVDQAQNELNLVQASQQEKQKNYDYAFAKVKALGGNTSATAESAATHQTQAEAALAQAKAEKIEAENEVNQKQTLLNQAQVESDAADENIKAKENALEKAENALKQLEAEINSSIVKKRADVDEKQNALDIAEKELEEKNVSISDAVEQKNKAEQALEEQEAELSVLQRELAAQTEDVAAAQIEVDKKQAAYDEIKAMIMQLLHAQADYNQKQQEEVTAKTEYKNAQNIVNTLEAALADAKDTQAEAQSKEERAKALSYDAAFLNQITDPDFTYLNDEISKVKDAQSREALLQKAYDAAKQKAAESEEAYGQAKLENVRTLAELAVAQTTYDKYLAEQKAQEAAAQAKADEESRKETEKIRQVFEQKDAADKYDNSKISQKAMSVKTGDKANAGGMLAVAGVAGMIAALAQKIKRREQD